MPTKEKKGEKKSKRRGEERKQILISAHARTLKANLASGTKARLVNNVLDSLNSFWLDSDLKMA